MPWQVSHLIEMSQMIWILFSYRISNLMETTLYSNKDKTICPSRRLCVTQIAKPNKHNEVDKKIQNTNLVPLIKRQQGKLWFQAKLSYDWNNVGRNMNFL